MGAVKAKVLEYDLELDRDGRLIAAGSPPHAVPPELSAEHLLLAGLARCSLASLEYHARRAALALAGSAAHASGRVTKRESDGRYAFVEIEVGLDVELDPLPGRETLDVLLAKAERDCFVSASLTASPRYRWRVNGDPA
jgi:organic hydroperoxide reductase OsmC/OhrA